MAATSPSVQAARGQALLATMRAAGHAGAGDRVIAVEQMEGGWSRYSYAARVAHAGGGERDYVVRVRPQGATLDTDLGAEFGVLQALRDAPLPAPPVRGYEPDDDSPFGGPFFVMDRVPGHAVNVWRGRDRRELAHDWEGPRGIAGDLADHLAAIHRVDPAPVAATVPVRDFDVTVDHWLGIYQEHRLVRDPVIDEAYAWVRARRPEPIAPRLVHGDYRIGNCLIDDGRISAILDWELCHIGDPRFDLGYMALDYSAGKFTAPGSSLLNATAEREWFWTRYTAASGIAVNPAVVATFAAIGALMLCAIMTTGMRIYAQRGSTDIRLAWSRFVIPGLRQDLADLMGW